MNDFKGRHFRGEVILWTVRWYCRYGISYRDLETMLAERGVNIDHSTINTDKAPTYGVTISELKKDGKLPDTVEHRQVKYLNDVIEADHGKLKQLIRPARGFKTLKTAYATIKGFAVMRALKKGQAKLWQQEKGIMGEVRLIERQFGVYTF